MGSRTHPKAGAEPFAPLARAYLEKQLQTLVGHESGARERGDPEAIHQLRVTTRRILAALHVIGGESAAQLAGDFKWLIRQSGKARDMDVLIEALDKTPGTARGGAIRNLHQHLKSERDNSRARLFEFLASERCAGLKSALGDLIDAASDAPSDKSCAGAIGELLASQLPPIKEFCDRVCKTRKPPPDKDLHRLRVRLKSLRYSLELFAPVYGKALRDFLKRLRKLQTQLGEFNDACIARKKLKGSGRSLRKLRQRRVEEARKLRVRICEKELPRLRKAIRKKQLRKFFGDVV